MKRKLGGLSLLEEAVALRDPSLYQGAGLLAWENGDDEVVDWQSEAWEFRCHCGVVRVKQAGRQGGRAGQGGGRDEAWVSSSGGG